MGASFYWHCFTTDTVVLHFSLNTRALSVERVKLEQPIAKKLIKNKTIQRINLFIWLSLTLLLVAGPLGQARAL